MLGGGRHTGHLIFNFSLVVVWWWCCACPHGCNQAGTTAVYDWLVEHPAVATGPVKELRVLDVPCDDEIGRRCVTTTSKKSATSPTSLGPCNPVNCRSV